MKKKVKAEAGRQRAVHFIARYSIGMMISKCGGVIHQASTILEDVSCAECLHLIFAERRADVDRAEKALLDVFGALVQRAVRATDWAESLRLSMEQWRQKANEAQKDLENHRLDQQLARKRKRKRAR